jgi:hypothetical protein
MRWLLQYAAAAAVLITAVLPAWGTGAGQVYIFEV